jgi:Rrf2 family transcriptional regulator, iron-sulfur cluster assembly transcription factor
MGPRLRGASAAAPISTGSAIFSHAPSRERRCGYTPRSSSPEGGSADNKRSSSPEGGSAKEKSEAVKLQKATMCGLYATLELAAHGGAPLPASEIAAKYGISLNHLAKVLRALVRAKLAESVRGAAGGYRFCGNPKRTTLLDIIALFEDFPGEEPDAPGGPEGMRALGGVLREIDGITIATLRSVSVATLLNIVEKKQRGAAADGPRQKVAAAGE